MGYAVLATECCICGASVVATEDDETPMCDGCEREWAAFYSLCADEEEGGE
jgi:hypothetical protein